MAFRTGDWVRSYSKGIWRIEREASLRYEPRYSLDAPRVRVDDSLFLLKRLVNEKGKAAFAVDSAAASTLKPITKVEAKKLQELLADESLSARFEAFAQPLDQILNLRFSLAKKSEFASFRKVFEREFAQPLQAGLFSDGILEIIAESPYADCYGGMPCSATLQFVCPDHEVRDGEFVYRRLNVHDF